MFVTGQLNSHWFHVTSGLFLFMWRALNEHNEHRVEASVEIGGGADNVYDKYKLFLAEFFRMWQHNNHRDYLAPSKKVSDTSPDVLAHLLGEVSWSAPIFEIVLIR
jgi:hypothetical protein